MFEKLQQKLYFVARMKITWIIMIGKRNFDTYSSEKMYE